MSFSQEDGIFLKICAFFGHSYVDYTPYKEQLKKIIIKLIEKCGVMQFYDGYRGNFDKICAQIIYELKLTYPNIKHIMVLSYHPNSEFCLPKSYDETVYLLEKAVPPKYAISRTNRCIVDRADYVVSGVRYTYGGAWSACAYAQRRKKQVINIFEQENNIISSL